MQDGQGALKKALSAQFVKPRKITTGRKNVKPFMVRTFPDEVRTGEYLAWEYPTLSVATYSRKDGQDNYVSDNYLLSAGGYGRRVQSKC